ncbi:MAG: peptidoglycan DD-metalloendopeptidase family protein [Polyangiales bacterium]
MVFGDALVYESDGAPHARARRRGPPHAPGRRPARARGERHAPRARRRSTARWCSRPATWTARDEPLRRRPGTRDGAAPERGLGTGAPPPPGRRRAASAASTTTAGAAAATTTAARAATGTRGTGIPVPVGTAVLASANGTVTATNNGCANTGYVSNPCGGRCRPCSSASDGSVTIYCHMQLNSIRVSRGRRVACGQTLEALGELGSSSGPHLHFGSGAARRARRPQDPFRGRCASGPVVWTQQRAYPAFPARPARACPPRRPATTATTEPAAGRIDDSVHDGAVTPRPLEDQRAWSCRAGTQTCTAGRWGACTGQVVPRAEDLQQPRRRLRQARRRQPEPATRAPRGTNRGVPRQQQTCRAGCGARAADEVVPRAETMPTTTATGWPTRRLRGRRRDARPTWSAGARSDAGADPTSGQPSNVIEEPDAAAEVDAGDKRSPGSPTAVEPFQAWLVDLGPEEDAEVPFDRENPR